MSKLLQNDTIARALSQDIADGDAALGSVPGLLRRVINENMWQERVLPENSQLVTFQHFTDFVTAPPLEGLGTTREVIEALCKQDDAILQQMRQLFEEDIPTANRNGTNRYTSSPDTSGLETDNKGYGNSREYRLARLKRDAPDLAELVINDEISAAEGMRQLKARQGKSEPFRRAINMQDAKSATDTIFEFMDRETIEQLIECLQNRLATLYVASE